MATGAGADDGRHPDGRHPNRPGAAGAPDHPAHHVPRRRGERDLRPAVGVPPPQRLHLPDHRRPAAHRVVRPDQRHLPPDQHRVAEVARRRVDTDSHVATARALLGMDAALMVAMVVFALAVSFEMAVAGYFVARVMRRVTIPISTAWINQSLTPNVRATVMSLNAQTDAVGQIAGGPLLGALAVSAGTRPPCWPPPRSSRRRCSSMSGRSASTAAT